MTIDKYLAINSLYNGNVTQKSDGSYEYHGSDPPPKEEDIQIKLTELEAEFEATRYQRDRKYPPISEQLDEIFWHGLEEWKKTIKKIKDSHPKP